MAKPTEPRTLAGWLSENPVVVLTIAGAAFYAALRLAYQAFYARLGLTPEDAGLSYGDALARAAGVALYFVAPVVLFLGLTYRSQQRRTRNGLLLAMGMLVGAFPLLWYLAYLDANEVQKGRRIRPLFITNIGIRAETARIAWTGDAPKGMETVSTHPLMFLGESGGSVVLYDVEAKRSLRIPSSDVAVKIEP